MNTSPNKPATVADAARESALAQPQPVILSPQPLLPSQELIEAANLYRRCASDHFVMDRRAELCWLDIRLTEALNGLQSAIDKPHPFAGPSVIEAANRLLAAMHDDGRSFGQTIQDAATWMERALSAADRNALVRQALDDAAKEFDKS